MFRVLRCFVVIVAFLAPGWWSSEDAVPFSERDVRRVLQHSPLAPMPGSSTNRFADDPAAARLGQYLFFDPRLSRNEEFSCATCHDPKLGYSDGKTLGVALSAVERHSMSLWNVAYNRWQFWDGRADSLWAQALQPIEDPRELGSSRVEVVHLFAADKKLRRAYEKIFGALPSVERLPKRARPIPTEPHHADHMSVQVHPVFCHCTMAMIATSLTSIWRDGSE